MAHIPYRPTPISPEEGLERGRRWLEHADTRRSVRFFDDRPVDRAMIELAIRAASTAPSGAHMQPWTFVAVQNPAMKHKIRTAVEQEEKETYEHRMSDAWRDALEPIGTDWQKPYLETVPWIVVLFAQLHGKNEDGSKLKHYYVSESCGIAAGMFIDALHQMGLSTLTHTPAPMTFLRTLLERPPNEKPMILFPIGYPTADATVPDLKRKPLESISVWF